MENRTHNLTLIFTFWILMFLVASSCSNQPGDLLADTFKNPPLEARPQVWWHWIYGNVSKDGITKDLELMSGMGIGGVTQFHNAWQVIKNSLNDCNQSVLIQLQYILCIQSSNLNVML